MNNPAPSADPVFKSGRPVFLLAMLVLLAPLVGLSAYQLAASMKEVDQFEDLSSIVHLKTTQVESWLTERYGDAMSLAASRDFIERVRSLQRVNNSRELNLTRDRLAAMRHSYGYESIALFGRDGHSILQLGPEGVPDHVATFTDLQRPLHDNEDIAVSELHRDEAGRAHLDVSLRLTLPGPRGPEPVGLVVLHVNPAAYLFPLIKVWPTASPSGEIYMARRDGEDALVLSELRYDPGKTMQLRYPGDSQTFPVSIALRHNDIGTTEGIDYRGQPIIAAYRPVANTTWMVVAKIDRREAMAGARQVGIWVGGIALFSAIILTMALYLLLKQRALAERLTAQLQADQLLRNFYTMPFTGMSIMSPKSGRWLQCNDRLCEMLGYSRDELFALSWEQLTHPDDLPANRAAFEAILRGESEGFAMEKRFLHKDGSIIHVQVDTRCVRATDGSPEYFVTTVQDITEHKSNEARILRLNQIYAALSHANEAILRSFHETELYEAVCRAAVESGQLKMAWVGLVDEASGLINPVSSFGSRREYLGGIRISVRADDPAGHGPIGIAVRENRPYWCQDFRHDPAAELWHERATTYGWASSASLPINRHGRAIGTLTIYSDTVHAFDNEAQQLLLRLVDNIGFALGSFDLRRQEAEAQNQLTIAEARWRFALDSGGHGIWEWDAQTNHVFFSHEWKAMLGYADDEIGDTLDEWERRVHPDDLPAVQHEIERHFKGETPVYVSEHRVLCKDGSYKWILDRGRVVQRDDAGQPLRVVGTHTDISMRKRVEEALVESEQQFRGIVEQSIVGVFIVQDDRLVYVNPRHAQILGYDDPQELIGRDMMSTVPDAERERIVETLRQRLEDRQHTIRYVTSALKKDGSVLDVSADGVVATYRGRPAIIGMMQDNSEKKRAEEAIQRYVKQLEEAFMRTVEVATTLSEMRDPYTAGHEKRVAEIAVAIGGAMGLDAHRLEGLRVAGHLHDIGKITIPSEILAKPGNLTATEYQLVKQHPQAGYDVLKNVGFPWPVADVALLHHERMDGSGYPKGLKGEEIPIEARIMAVADVVESMASHRPYRPGLGLGKALEEIERGRGTAYDTVVADTCIRLFREKGYVIPV